MARQNQEVTPSLNNGDMVALYHTQLQSELDVFYETQQALFIHGTFGIGKSFAVKEYAKRKAVELGLEFSENAADINDPKKFVYVELILHQYDPASLTGLPYANTERTKTIYLPMGLLPETGQGIIFFDEMNLATPILQSNAYQIIETRKLGFYKVPDGYISIGAGNLEDDRGHTYDLAMPLNNRFSHIQLNVPAVDDFELPNRGGSELIVGWANGFAIPNGVDFRIVNFLKFQSGYLYKFDPSSDTKVIVCATPRTWAKTSARIKNIPYSPQTEHRLERQVGMGVGASIGVEFVSWLALSKDYDIPKIFKEEKINPIPTEIDYKYSLISALLAHYQSNYKGKDAQALAVKLLHLAMLFRGKNESTESTAMILSQAKVIDPTIFDKIRVGAPAEFKSLSNDLFKLLI